MQEGFYNVDSCVEAGKRGNLNPEGTGAQERLEVRACKCEGVKRLVGGWVFEQVN